MKRLSLSRRTFLKGLGGAAVPLPLLEIMRTRAAHAQAATPPPRFLVTFGGVSVGPSANIVPSKLGRGYDLKRALLPLGQNAIQNDVSVVSGLRIPQTGPGGWTGGDWHCASMGPLISGVRATGLGGRSKNAVALGPTSDQVVADAIAGATRFRSLELRVQPQVYRENTEVMGTISYRRNPAGGLQPNAAQSSPRQAYNSIFTGFQATTSAEAAQRQALLAQDKSILDLVRGRAEKLMTRLGTPDKQRLQRHFDEIRDLENRIAEIPTTPTGSTTCALPPDPGADDPIGTTDAGVIGCCRRIYGWANEEKRARIMSDLLHMAFTCDLTRSATLAYTFAQCFVDTKYLLGIKQTDVHELSHGAGTLQDWADSVGWHVKHFAYLVGKLRDTPEAGGSVLDRTVLVFLTEGGYGTDAHSGENMVALIAGRAGGLKPGQHVAATGKHPVNVLISAMNAVGVQTDSLGEIAGAIPQLFA